MPTCWHSAVPPPISAADIEMYRIVHAHTSWPYAAMLACRAVPRRLTMRTLLDYAAGRYTYTEHGCCSRYADMLALDVSADMSADLSVNTLQ